MYTFYTKFAAEYNCGAYGAGTYDSQQVCGTDSGSLANTGTNVVVGITGGVLLIAVAIVILFTTRRKKNKPTK